jgi:hypothetical protein
MDVRDIEVDTINPMVAAVADAGRKSVDGLGGAWVCETPHADKWTRPTSSSAGAT